MDFTSDGFLDETVKRTPKPTACSTETKKRIEPKPFSFSISNSQKNSLGVMSLEDVDLTPELEVPRREMPNVSSDYTRSTFYKEKRAIYDKLMADQTAKLGLKLHEISGKSQIGEMSLPSRYFRAETQLETPTSRKLTESTVNESDLIGMPVYNDSKNVTDDVRRASEQLANISNQLRNSDVSFKEIFNKYSFANSTFEEMDSAMFEPVETAMERLNAEEVFWRREHDLPANRASTFSQPNTLADSKLSMGEFFRGKSDNCSAMFQKKSPEKRKPVALVNEESTVMDSTKLSTDGSVLSISSIKNLISNGAETPNKLVEKMVKMKHTNNPLSKQLSYFDNRKSLDSPNSKNKKGNVRKFISTTDLTCSKSMNCLEEDNKENVNRSLTSLKSACSIETLSGTKTPLVCTKAELVYGCVKVGKIATQNFVVKNRSELRMRFQVNSTNPNYKISKLDTDPMAMVIILLHPNECRQFTITFSPTTRGVQTGTLNFYPMIKGDIRKEQRQVLNLYGYGGHFCIDMQDLPKDTSGKLWLPLGSLNSHNSTMIKEFKIKNSGTLPGFAHLGVRSKSLYSYATINISPSSIVLHPGQQVSIQVEYIITKDDYRIFCKAFKSGTEVTEIAHITIVSGPEVLRGRLRKLNEYVTQKNLLPDKLVSELTKEIPGECMPDDLKHYKDTVSNIHGVLNELSRKEVTITVEQDMDKTICAEVIDETSQYQTLMNNHSNMTVVERNIVETLLVEPSNVLLTPPFKVSDSILLTCECTSEVQYEIKTEPEGFLKISNRMGVVKPGQTKIVNLSCAEVHFNDKQQVKIMIFTEHQLYKVDVKILNNLNA